MTAAEPPPQTLRFLEQGLLGFESVLDYELSAYDQETPFYWLRASSDPDLAFLVMEPGLLLDDYAFDLPDEEAQALNIQNPADILVLVILTIPEDPLQMSANLLGPLVFNRRTHLGRQLILDAQRYPLRFPVLPAEGESPAC